jgi:hypothetical protein
MRKILLILLTLVLFHGCSLFFRMPLEIPTSLAPAELHLNMGVEPSGLRIDVHRNYTTEQTTDSEGKTVSNEVPVDYHPLGVYLSDVLFFDLNRNLCLVVPRLFKIEPGADYEIAEVRPGLFNDSRFTVVKEGNTITQQSDALFFKKSRTITYSENEINISDNGLLPFKSSIKIEPDQLKYIPSGILSGLSTCEIVKKTNGYSARAFLQNMELTQDSPDKIELDRHFYIEHNGSRIIIRRYGNKNKPTSYLFKTKSGYTITTAFSERIININQGMIEFTERGRIQRIFELK